MRLARWSQVLARFSASEKVDRELDVVTVASQFVDDLDLPRNMPLAQRDMQLGFRQVPAHDTKIHVEEPYALPNPPPN